MINARFPHNAQMERRKTKQPVMSDADGTHDGGLVFIVGFMGVSLAHSGDLTSFGGWFVLLMMSAAIAVCVQKTATRLYGYAESDGAEVASRS